jgi:hypothetical protein
MWQSQGTTADLRIGPFSGRLDLRRPAQGLVGLHLQGRALARMAVLQVRSGSAPAGQEEELLDSFVRGADLIATYSQAPDRTIVPQIYWRAIEHADLTAVGVELVLSVRTELLDDDPKMFVGSLVPRCPVWCSTDPESKRFEPVAIDVAAPRDDSRARPIVLVYRLPDVDCSWVEMVHPMDFSGAVLSEDTTAEGLVSRFELFNERLEKGVIRRGRLQGIFVPRDGDQIVAQECYRRFATSAIPLTV